MRNIHQEKLRRLKIELFMIYPIMVRVLKNLEYFML